MKKQLFTLAFVSLFAVSGFATNATAVSHTTRFGGGDSLGDTQNNQVIHIDFSQFDHIALYAQVFQGIPYRWGGMSEETGFDCSGFIKYLLNIFGYEVPHSAAAIAQLGQRIDLDQAQKGDMVFFKTSRRKGISHMGMVIEADGERTMVIHASSSRGIVIEDLNTSNYLRPRLVKTVRLDLDAIRKPAQVW